MEAIGLQSSNGDGEEIAINGDVLQQMFLHSPMARVDDVVTPSLVGWKEFIHEINIQATMNQQKYKLLD